MSNPRTAAAAASVREQKLARVIDREVAPIWHDRFARMLLRDLPNRSGAVVLDVHTGPGHTTAELLERLDESSRVVALGRDPLLMQIAKTSVRQEWKRRVYFKTGDIDDVMEMGDATYDLTVANLVLGEHVVDWKAALAELRRVTKPGGHVLATVPLHGTWDEVEDLFEELLRDEGMSAEVLTLKQLRRRRPKPGHLVRGLEEMGLGPNDFVVEHERFEMLFRSGREFLFAPVIEHGPLRLWKAILGRAEQPQALFWRFKEVIDTYYVGKVLGVSVVAGLIRMRVPGGGGTEVSGANKSFASSYWSRYPELTRLWGAGVAGEDDIELDVDFGDDDDDADSDVAIEPDSGVVAELEGELPAVAALALDHDPFAHLLDELDAADEGVPPLEPEPEPEPIVERPTTGRTATLGTVGTPSGSPAPPRRPVKPTVALPTTSRASSVGETRPPAQVGTPKPVPTPAARAVPTPAPPAATPVVPMPIAPSPSRPIVVGKPTTGPAPAVPKPIAPSASKPIPVPVAPKPPTTGKVPTVGPKLDASKPLIEDDFLDGIDELDELDELGDDEDLSESFGRIEPDPDTARTGPAIPPRAPPKK